uniref:Uncharacterized protein n=1 Tax=Hucho hucho TaxID=62062 RepID=A0A4W5LV37_9TELE
MAELVKQDYYRFPSVSKLKPEDFDDVQDLLTNCVYLQDSDVTVKGFRIYGTPCTLFHHYNSCRSLREGVLHQVSVLHSPLSPPYRGTGFVLWPCQLTERGSTDTLGAHLISTHTHTLLLYGVRASVLPQA